MKNKNTRNFLEVMMKLRRISMNLEIEKVTKSLEIILGPQDTISFDVTKKCFIINSITCGLHFPNWHPKPSDIDFILGNFSDDQIFLATEKINIEIFNIYKDMDAILLYGSLYSILMLMKLPENQLTPRITLNFGKYSIIYNDFVNKFMIADIEQDSEFFHEFNPKI